MELNKRNGRAAYNMRFYESGGVTPQKKQCEIASTSPAETVVSPAFIKPLGRYMPPRGLHREKLIE